MNAERNKEIESYLTFDDFKRTKPDISLTELEEFNGHVVGEVDKQTIDYFFDKNSLTHHNLAILPLFRSEYPTSKNYYKENKEQSLLEQTPIADQYFLHPGTFMEGYNKKAQSYRCGHSEEEAVVKRFLNKDGKWAVKKNLYPYMALTRICLFYELENYPEKIYVYLDPGDVFHAPKTGENREKRKKILKDKKISEANKS